MTPEFRRYLRQSGQGEFARQSIDTIVVCEGPEDRAAMERVTGGRALVSDGQSMRWVERTPQARASFCWPPKPWPGVTWFRPNRSLLWRLFHGR